MTILKICIIGKYPPIQGGVSRQMFWMARCFAELGHQVHYVTNSEEVELEYRMYIPSLERKQLEYSFENGGYVKLHTTSEPQLANYYIPYTNPFISKLAAIGFDVVTQNRCDFIYTSYLEPYGFAGALVSSWTGIPYSVQHAGSDVGRLAQMQERRSAYLEVIRHADLVVSSGSMSRPLMSAGVKYENLYIGVPGYLPETYFTSNGEVLDIGKLLEEVKGTEFTSLHENRNEFDPTKPTIGIYGKPGMAKGTAELVQALALLKQEGKEFNFVALCGVKGARVNAFRNQIKKKQLEDYTYFLPFIPHWIVPQFLRACTAICFLENRFPILIHQPQIAREIATCGRCLILSQEILEKQYNKKDFIDNKNYLLIPDPQDIYYMLDRLRWVVDNPQSAEKIGFQGNKLYPLISDPEVYKNLLERIAEIVAFKKETNMSLLDFQRVIAKIYVNTEFRELLESQSNQALQEYKLEPHEMQAITDLAILKPQISRFSDSLYQKVFGFLWKRFSLTNQHFNEIESELHQFFNRKYDFATRSNLEQIDWFANLLLAFAEIADMTGCFKEIVKYDLIMLRATLSDFDNHNFAEINKNQSISDTKNAIKHVFKSPSIHMEKFNYDIVALYSGASIEQLQQEAHWIVFVPSENNLTAEVHDLSKTVYYLVNFAQEKKSIDDLIQAVANFNRIDTNVSIEFKEACKRAVDELCAKKILISI